MFKYQETCLAEMLTVKKEAEHMILSIEESLKRTQERLKELKDYFCEYVLDPITEKAKGILEKDIDSLIKLINKKCEDRKIDLKITTWKFAEIVSQPPGLNPGLVYVKMLLHPASSEENWEGNLADIFRLKIVANKRKKIGYKHNIWLLFNRETPLDQYND